MAGKITDYPTTTSLIDEDLFDLSKYDGVSAYATNAIKWEDILKEIQIDLTFNNIYNNNGTIGTGRTATLTDSLSFVSGQVIAAASAAGYASLNIPSGTDPSSPVDGDLWFNGTNLYFRDGTTSIDLLGGDGNGIFDAANNGGVIPTTFAVDVTNNFAIQGSTSVPIATFTTATGVLIGGSGTNPHILTLDTSANTGLLMKRESVDMLKVTYNSRNPTLRMYNQSSVQVVNINAELFVGHTYFNHPGNFGIGTITPTEKLEVVGSIKMVDGNQALGKVLTSDANGVGSWDNVVGGIFEASNNGSVVPTTYAVDIQNTLAIRGVTSVPIATFNTSTGLLIGGASPSTYNLSINTVNVNAFVMQRNTVDMLKVTYNAANPTLRMYNSTSGEVVNIAATAFAAYPTYFNSPSNFGIGTTTPTDKLQVVGTVDATRYKVGGLAGANFSGAVTNITVVDGIVTAVS